ncbi:MAG: 4-alpha-glucanotransferase [Nitrospirota bacterium]
MTERAYEDLIRELSELCGIMPEYWDIFGVKHETSFETMKGILRAMKCAIDSPEDVAHEIDSRRWRTWRGFLEPVHVVSVSEQPLSVPIYVPVEEGTEDEIWISWVLEEEGKSSLPANMKSSRKKRTLLSGDRIGVSEVQRLDGKRYVKFLLTDTRRRKIGYYRATVRCKHREKAFPGMIDRIERTSRIIVAPDACYLPGELSDGRSWGFSINLYTVRSHRNWGIGDLTDLKNLIAWAAGLGAGFVGINPLHAIPNTRPFGVSPYSPLTRLYKNFAYLDPEQIPEYSESEDVRKTVSSREFKRTIKGLRSSVLIDSEAAAGIKERILRMCFDLFHEKHYVRNTHYARKFKKYVSGEGHHLESFALSMSMWKQMMGKGVYAWQGWPEAYRDPSGRTVRAFKRKNEKEILFHEYVQWNIDRQLESVQKEAKKRGMTLGVYHDLAVGSIGGGTDAWNNRGLFAFDADAGAPPDDFSPDGQRWGFPPLIPEEMRETGYELFIQTIRKNMRRGGALRIDHALGLFRLFWIPLGLLAKDGAYIRYPFEDLMRITALESARNKTVVIAEDLGTIGEHVRETLGRFRMLSYRLFYFERNYPDPSFLSPDRYPEMALCAVTTHDLPTIRGYWKGRDIEVSEQAGKYPDESVRKRRLEERERDRWLLISALKSRGVLGEDFPSDPKMTPETTPDICRAVYHYLALTPCKMLSVSFDDVIGALDQQNLPGTIDAHPNWIRRTPMALEDAMKDKRFRDLASVLKKRGL